MYLIYDSQLTQLRELVGSNRLRAIRKIQIQGPNLSQATQETLMEQTATLPVTLITPT